MNPTKLSKFLSLVLRHDPASIGITLDPQGWVDCSDLIAASIAHGMPIDQQTLVTIVRDSDKKRFALSEDGRRIRANQGHSVAVDLELAARTPPDELFHGTVAKYLDPIFRDGLKKGERHHVHLSPDRGTAIRVGERRGNPTILRIKAAEMAAAGFEFYRSANGVWLTDHVPPQFIEIAPAKTTLYRPVGPEELKLIEESGWKSFPPRLPDQPIFYPVTNEPYAIQIARDWNVKASGSGFVTRFDVDSDYLQKFPTQTVGGSQHTEFWVPAEDLAEFNSNIIGLIEITQRFPQDILP
jgi:RNA:NAD 2''-phosphotransferase